MHAQLDLTSLSQRTTVAAWHLMILQSYVVAVPETLKDRFPHPERSRLLDIFRVGNSRPTATRGGSGTGTGKGEFPLWKSSDVESSEGSAFSIEQVALLPKHDIAQPTPTTLPG